MSQITVDLNDNPVLLGKIAGFLQELSGGPELAVVVAEQEADTQTKGAEIEHDIPASEGGVAPDPVVVFGGKAVNPNLTTSGESEHTGSHNTAPTVPVDSSGKPWDKRIHATTKTKKADGTWKALRNVNASVVAQVEAESFRPDPVIPSDLSKSMLPATVPPNQPAAMTVDPNAITWPVVLQKVVAAQNAGTLDDLKKDAFLIANGITGGFPLIANRPELFAAFLKELGL